MCDKAKKLLEQAKADMKDMGWDEKISYLNDVLDALETIYSDTWDEDTGEDDK